MPAKAMVHRKSYPGDKYGYRPCSSQCSRLPTLRKPSALCILVHHVLGPLPRNNNSVAPTEEVCLKPEGNSDYIAQIVIEVDDSYTHNLHHLIERILVLGFLVIVGGKL